MRLTGHLALALTLVVLTANRPVEASQSDPAVRIENEHLAVVFDTQALTFTVASKASAMPFIEKATLRRQAGKVRRHDAHHTIWGRGQTIELEYDDGAIDRLTLFEGSPFLVFNATLSNAGPNDLTVNRIHPLRLTLALERKPEDLRALGTAGLTGLDRKSNPGSYSFLAVADPDTRAGLVAGWISHDRGSGVFFSDLEEGQATVDARLDYGRLLIEPGCKATSETLVLGYFKDARLGLEAYADAVATYYGIVLPPQPTVYCTWYHAGASNQRDILANAQFARKHLAPFGFSVIQIDDKWQAGEQLEGPRKNFTTHRPDGPYPAGMAPTATELTRLGMVPGIWFMPFAGTWNDPYFADKQHFFARRDGKPYVVHWGGTCFDLTHPDTRQYVFEVARRIGQDWGYRYFKLDGLWTGLATGMCYINTGYQEDDLGSTDLHDPRITHVQAYRDGLKLVREAAGRDVFLLGCNMAQNMRTMGASFGLLDAMRVGPDNGRKWPQICRGPFSGSNTYFLHGRVWYNDPDPIYVRDSVPLEHARALASWVALTGQLNASSIQFADLSPERLHLLQRTMPAHPYKPRPVDLFEQPIPRLWLLRAGRGPVRRDVIGLFNWEEQEPIEIQHALAKVGLRHARAGYVGFDYWADKFVEPFKGTLKATLAPASCRILAVRPVADRPQVLSTSRHITQGIVDVVAEQWDAETNTLTGTSRVVAGDPYELRIAAMGPSGPWRVRDLSASAEDNAQTVTIKLREQDDWKIRVQIDARQNCLVRWSVKFQTPP